MKKSAFLFGLAFVLFHCSVSRGAVVSTILTLDAPSPASNTLALNLALGATPLGSANTELTGTLLADIDIDQTTGVISSFRLTGGDMVGSDWSMLTVLGFTINTTGTTATGGTDTDLDPAPPTSPNPSVVTGGNFNGAEHFIMLTGGTSASTDAVPPFSVPLADTPISGAGTGTLTSTLNGGQYDLVFSLGINDTEALGGGDLNIVGAVTATGSVTAIPEPTGFFALVSLVVGVAVRRRR